MSALPELDDTVKEFLTESRENLDRLDQDFVALERNPSDSARVAGIFRTLHTIKGTSGFFGFDRLGRITHAGESLLAQVRDEGGSLTSASISALLRLVDAVRVSLDHVDATGQEAGEAHDDLIEELGRLKGELATTVSARAPGSQAASAGKRKRARRREPPVAEIRSAAVPTETAPHPSGPIGPAADATPTAQAASESTVRVNVAVLDNLMNMVGELVLARNRMLELSASATDSEFVSTVQRLTALTTELQEGVMRTRMQPIASVWSKLPRIVRDLAAACGKQVRLELDGQNTELDRTVVEAIRDPLTHIVRNAIDHGIEEPAARLARGKDMTGTLSLRASHEAGQVVIEIADDGGGIDPDRVKNKAVEARLISPDRARQMSDLEAQELIFAPGLSTAAQVTNVSGRGVGMDVVKTNVEHIGGSVDIQSAVGRGTRFRIRLPLTLAIVPALVVSCRGERFAIPQPALVELMRFEQASGDGRIERLAGTPLVRLRGELLPVVYLSEVFELGAEPPSEEGHAVNMVVLQADGRRFALVVDQINDTQEVVVKPLGVILKKLPYFAGATIMGDGRVALIVDVAGIASRADLAMGTRDLGRQSADAAGALAVEAVNAVVLFGIRGGAHLGVPLGLVTRLEEVRFDAVETTRSGPVIQYRKGIMPLIDVSAVLHGSSAQLPPDESNKIQVIVYTREGKSYGLLVQQIVDIVHETAHVAPGPRAPGLLGVAVVRGKAIDLLDPGALVDMALRDPQRSAA